MSSPDQPHQPSADDIEDPTLQAEIANPADSNDPTGSTATDQPTAADDGPIDPAAGSGEPRSDEVPPQDGSAETGPDTAAGAATGASTAGGDETGVEGIQGEDAREPTEAGRTAPGDAEEAPAPTTAEQPPGTADGADPADASLPVDEAAAADAAAAETTPVAAEERAGEDAAPPDQQAAVELDEERAQVLSALRDALGDEAVVAHWARERGDLWVRVRPQDWRAAAEASRAQGFTYFCFLSAIDWLPSPFGKSEEGGARTFPDVQARIEGAGELEHGVTGGETRFQLLARVYSIAKRIGLVFKADLPEDGPVAETWTGVYAGADWHEREAHEMFGIGFAGHPYLVNLYLPGAFEGHPLRKDFPLLAREVKPWPGIVDVEAMPGEPEASSDAAEASA